MIIKGQRYEAEPAVEAYVKDLQAENEEQRREILRLTDELKEMDGANEYLRNQSAKDFENVLKFMDTIGALKKENARLEEGYQKSVGVIAATDCAECKKDAETVKHGEWEDVKFSEGVYKDSDDSNDIGLSITSAKCSLCQRYSERLQQYRPKMPAYCSHCGAKMDLKDGESE